MDSTKQGAAGENHIESLYSNPRFYQVPPNHPNPGNEAAIGSHGRTGLNPAALEYRPQSTNAVEQRLQPIGTFSQGFAHNHRAAYLPPAYPADARFAHLPHANRGHNQQSNNEAALLWDPHHRFSNNYRGSRTSRDNYSANIPDEHNCSVFMKFLPPTCTPTMLLQQIPGCGSKIYAMHMNERDDKLPHHCAAKVVFSQRCGVDWLFARIRAGQFIVTDANGIRYAPMARYNKTKAGAQPVNDHRSRVLVVGGPPSVVSPESMDAFFKHSFYHRPDCSVIVIDRPDWRVIEFHFESTRNQSENGMRALQRLMVHGPESFTR